MASVSPNREIILEMLLSVNKKDRFSHIVLRQTLDKYQYLPKTERAFITRVFEGTIENRLRIDYWIDGMSTVAVSRMKPVIREIIRMSVYQIVFMDGVQDYAVVNEAVGLAQKKGFYNLKGFVNGLLRNFSRRKDELPMPDERDEVRYLSVLYSMPEWIVSDWLNRFGREVCEGIFRAFLEEGPTTLRFRQFAVREDQIIELLEADGVTVEPAAYLPHACHISGYSHIPGLKAFREGLVAVQDESSQLVSLAAGPERGMNVLDLCAAPGGKSLHMGDLLKGTGHVLARDLTDHKVELIQENIQRQGAINVEAQRFDATVQDKKSYGAYDIVLADLPCSGLGVIGKKTDIKYRTDPEGIKELVRLQRAILTRAASYVKPGGVLIYSTCTISMAENEDNVSWFLNNFPYLTESLDPYIPESLHSDKTKRGMLQLIPGVHQCDGFFLCRLRRKDA